MSKIYIKRKKDNAAKIYLKLPLVTCNELEKDNPFSTRAHLIEKYITNENTTQKILSWNKNS